MAATRTLQQTRRSKHDYLAILEAAYSGSGSDDDWVQGIADAARPIFDQGLGVLAYGYDARDLAAPRLCGWAQSGGERSVRAEAAQFLAALSPEVSRAMFSPGPPVESQSQLFERAAPTLGMVRAVGAAGFNDAMGVKGHNPDGRGITLAALTRGRAKLAPRATWALTRVALHLAAAARLRWQAQAVSGLAGADAIFTAKGRIEHLVSGAAAPRVLEKAVESRLAANSRRASPEQSLELWRALFAGRWSIVDHVDSDGKRFILAKRNETGVDEPAALTNTERLLLLYASWGHSNKLISYELGLAPSTVSTLLRQALRKLRLRSRTELIRMLANVGVR